MQVQNGPESRPFDERETEMWYELTATFTTSFQKVQPANYNLGPQKIIFTTFPAFVTLFCFTDYHKF